MNQILKNVEQAHTDILHQVFDLSTEGFQVIDKNWRYVYVNETAAKQGRSTVGELTGHTMMEKYSGIEKQPFFEQLKRCMDEQVGIRMENEFVYPDAQKGWFQLFIHPWSGGIMIFSIDVTYRKLAEKHLLETIEHFKGAATTAGDRKNFDELRTAVENLGKPSVTVIG